MLSTLSAFPDTCMRIACNWSILMLSGCRDVGAGDGAASGCKKGCCNSSGILTRVLGLRSRQRFITSSIYVFAHRGNDILCLSSVMAWSF